MNGLVFAHTEGPLTPQELWRAWNVELSIVAPLALFAVSYMWGTLNAWRRAGAGHGITMQHCIRVLGAMLALVFALMSPLDAISGELFSAHMVQHLVLMLVAAPLLVLSNLSLAVLWALPRHWAQSLGQRWNQSQTLPRLWKALNSPLSAWILFVAPLWIWHASTLYQFALRHEAIHILEHLGFLITAMLFWRVLFKHTGQKNLRYGMAIPYLFTTSLHSGILGALMTFTARPWYPYYATHVAAWGLTPLQDQQIGGLIMWIPGGFVLTLLTVGYFAAWLRALEERSVQLQRRDVIPTHHKLQ